MAGTYNYLPTNAFDFRIKELPNVEFYCQELTLPTIGSPETEISFPGLPLRVAGNTTNFSTLDVTFIIDERMENYGEVFKWVVGQRSGSKYSEQYGNLYSEAVLSVYTANSTSNRIIQFTGLFPVGLGSVNFRTTDTSIEYTTCTASFAFTEFDFR